MKSVISSKTTLIIAALSFSFLTCYGQQESSGLLAGKWTRTVNETTVTYTISSDSKYQVDFVENGSVDVWGSYDISGNQITFTDEGGDYSADVPGVYAFKVDDASMSLEEIDDPVDGRRMLVEGEWSKSGEIEE